MERKRVLVVGKSGQLARCLAEEAKSFSTLQLDFRDREQVDVCGRALPYQIDAFRPPLHAIINTAAFHDLQACETDFDTAFAVNALGVANLLGALPQGCYLYHLSTDYVFDGLQGVLGMFGNEPTASPQCNDGIRGYRIQQQPRPLNNYGRTKRAGELIALDSGRATVIRTSSLFSKYGSSGKGGSNFLLAMLKKAAESNGKPIPPAGSWYDRETETHEVYRGPRSSGEDGVVETEILKGWEIAVDSDVVMSPTYTPWLARSILHMVYEEVRPPLCHLVCEGPPVSWFDFAKAIFETGGFADALSRLTPKHSNDWPPRPRFSALQNSIPHISMGTWQAALEHFFLCEWPKMKEGQT